MKVLMLSLISLIVLCCSGEQVKIEKVTVEFKAAQKEANDSLIAMSDMRSGDTLYVANNSIITNKDIEFASVDDQDGHTVIELQMNNTGTKKLADYTENHIGSRVAIILDGELILAPTIRAPLTDGKAMITGNFTKKEAEKITRGIMVR